jgi:predicted phage-related endonuclease
MNLIPKPPHGSEAWLKARWRDPWGNCTFGASDAPALMAASPYTSRSDLWLDKVDEPEVQPTNAVFERGNALEPALGTWAGQQLGKYLFTPEVMYHQDRFTISLDFVDDEKNPTLIVEAKTTTRYSVSSADDLPNEWLWQGHAQHLVVGVPVYFAVLDRDMSLSLTEMPIYEDWLAALAEESEHFGKMVDNNEVEPAIIADMGVVQLSRLYPESAPDSVTDIGPLADVVDELREVNATMKALEARQKDLKAELMRELGEYERGTVDGVEVVTWKTQKGREGLDTAALKAAHPDLYQQFLKRGAPFRVMRLKGEK